MLVRAVESVLTQTFTDFEILIVDDCSTDETPEMVGGLDDPRIRLLRHGQNRGQSAARNTGIANARGEYLAFLDDDDEFLPTKIEQQVQVLDAAPPEVGMVYVWVSRIGPSGDVVGESCRTSEGYVFEEALALGLSLTICSTAMLRRSVFDVVGRFDETIRRAADADFFCRVTRDFRIASILEILVRYHIGHPSLSEPYNVSKRELIVRRDYVLCHQAKYSVELASRGHVRSAVWRRLAIFEWRIGNHAKAMRAILHAFVADPKTAWYVARFLGKWAFGRLVMPIPQGRK